VGSTAAHTVGGSTGPGGRVRSCRTLLPAPRFQLSFQKTVGHRQLSNLGVQVPDLIFIDQRRLPAAAFKDTGRAIEQRTFPLIDYRPVNTEPARQLRHVVRAYAAPLEPRSLQSPPFSASSATFALNSGACCFRFDIFHLLRGEDQQTANRRLRQCPAFRENFTIDPLRIRWTDFRVI
jgi:hypothetical protein